MRKLLVVWAALGITLSTATQLRMGMLGPGEVVLVVWIAFMGLLMLRGIKLGLGSAFRTLFFYWLAAFVLLGFGAMVAVMTHQFTVDAAVHDGLSFAYAAVISCIFCVEPSPDGRKEYHLNLARTIVAVFAVSFFMLAVVAIAVPALGPVHFWYAGARFQGWTSNPNQMALALVALPFLGWYVLQNARGVAGKAIYALLIGASLLPALATKSDALRVAWAGALLATLGMQWIRTVFKGRSRRLYISHTIVPLLVLFVAMFFGKALLDEFYDVAEGVYAEGQQGEKRFTLWRHGLQAIGQSPLVGFGPGSFSGYSQPFENTEAHNSLIDWGMSTGALGIALHVGLWMWCGWRALQSGSLSLLGAVAAVAIFSLFGYTMRQPVYWLVLVLVLALSERERSLGIAYSARTEHASADNPPFSTSPIGLATAPAWRVERNRRRRNGTSGSIVAVRRGKDA